jgi:hypothetical protein
MQMRSRKRYIQELIVLIVLITVIGCSSDLFEINRAPEIVSMNFSAYEVDPGDTVQIILDIKDTDEVLHYSWSANGGSFIPPTDRSEVEWKAPLEGGQYRITVKVSNDKKSTTKHQNVTVRSYTKPLVEILAPQNGEYLVQYSDVVVQAFAQHNNGIHHLNFFIDDTLKQTINGHVISSEYEFVYPLSVSPGEKEMKIEAFANITEAVGRDSIQITIEGILLGKEN